MAKLTISLDDDQMLELGKLARESGVSENDVVREAIDRLLQSYRGPGTPRFARRLGPLVIGEHDRSATDTGGDKSTT
ncbi:MAG TPA: ribbon-helix-helix protein, CopG family [Candidatus Dormibacteraeota bacterium]